jgi:hypothetical protein
VAGSMERQAETTLHGYGVWSVEGQVADVTLNWCVTGLIERELLS